MVLRQVARSTSSHSGWYRLPQYRVVRFAHTTHTSKFMCNSICTTSTEGNNMF